MKLPLTFVVYSPSCREVPKLFSQRAGLRIVQWLRKVKEPLEIRQFLILEDAQEFEAEQARKYAEFNKVSRSNQSIATIAAMKPHQLLQLKWFQRFVASKPLHPMPRQIDLIIQRTGRSNYTLGYSGIFDKKIYFDSKLTGIFEDQYIFEYSPSSFKALAWGLMDCYLKQIKAVNVYTFDFQLKLMKQKQLPKEYKNMTPKIWAGCKALEKSLGKVEYFDKKKYFRNG